MIIQFNTDHHSTATEEFKVPLIASISKKLSRLAEHITRLDVHLKNENENRGGLNDKRCMLEAHIEGSHLVSVTSHANTYEQAVAEAIDKLKSSLNTVQSRLKNHKPEMKTTIKFIFACCLIAGISIVLNQCKSPAVPGSTGATITTDTVSVDTLKSVAAPAGNLRTPLTLIIKNLDTKNSPIYVSLYDSSNKFPSKTDRIKEYKFMSDGNTLTEQINDMRYGEFAIATYQDLNSDGKCNRNLIGLPKEPYGFSNNFKPTVRAPRFGECNFAYNADKHTLTIAMIR